MDSSKYHSPYSLAQDLFSQALLCWKIHIIYTQKLPQLSPGSDHGCWRWHYVLNLYLPLWSSVAICEGRRLVADGHGDYVQKTRILQVSFLAKSVGKKRLIKLLTLKKSFRYAKNFMCYSSDCRIFNSDISKNIKMNWLYIYIYTYIRTYIYIYMHIHIYIHTHVSQMDLGSVSSLKVNGL